VVLAHLRRLRSETYDRVFDLQGNLKSGVHTLLVRGLRKTGYAKGHTKERNHWFTHERIAPPSKARHRIEKAVSLVNPDFERSAIERPELHIPQDLIQEAEEAVRALRKNKSPLMIVHPGTSAFGVFKRWAPENFGALAKRLHQERGFETLVLWGPGEEDLAKKTAGSEQGCTHVAPPTRSLLHLAAFIRCGDVYVSADSGPLHLANYIGVPCLGLFGPKDPTLYRPYFPPSRVVRSEVDCSPCTKRTCDDSICMKNLSLDAVFEALCGLLDEKNQERDETA
jgi:ADP-heptose:LPS heptosyltransferase